MYWRGEVNSAILLGFPFAFMTSLPEAPRASVTAFEASVGRVATGPAITEAELKELQSRTQELVEHLRTDIQNRAYALRALLRIDVALHGLRASPATDPRVVALQAAKSTIEERAMGMSSEVVLRPLHGFGHAARDVWSSGIVRGWNGQPIDGTRVATSVGMVAGGAALGFATLSGVGSALSGDGPAAARQTMRQRVGGFFTRLLAPLAAFTGFLMLGRLASLRASTQANPETREERSYILTPDRNTTPAIRGMTFVRGAGVGGEVLLEKDGNRYSMNFENLPGIPAPTSGEENFGAMLSRLYTSGSTGSGVGVERGGVSATEAIGIRSSESFVLTEAGIDAIRSALATPDAALPAGTTANVTLRMNLRTMSRAQLAMVRRCIARGGTIATTDDGMLTLTTTLRLRRTTAATVVAPPALTLDAPRALGTLTTATHAYACPAGATVQIGPAGPGAMTIAAGASRELAPGVTVRRASDTRIEIDLLATAAPATAYTFRVNGHNITFSTPAAGPASAADTVTALNLATGRARTLAGELATFTAAGLAAHTGSPETFAGFSAKLTELNGLIPAAHRTDAGVVAAVEALLGVGTPPLRDKRITTAGGTYKVTARNAQLACELVPAVTGPETLDPATARNLTLNETYRIALPAGTKRVIVSGRALTGNALTIDGSRDSFIEKPAGWTSYSAADGPAHLSVVGGTHVHITVKRRGALRVRFDEDPPTTGSITAAYTVS